MMGSSYVKRIRQYRGEFNIKLDGINNKPRNRKMYYFDRREHFRL